MSFDPWQAARQIVQRGIERGAIIPPVLERFANSRTTGGYTPRNERQVIDEHFGAGPDQLVSRSEARGVCMRPVVWEYLEVAASETRKLSPAKPPLSTPAFVSTKRMPKRFTLP